MEWKNTLLRRLMAAAVSVCMLLPLAACTKAPAETTVPAEPVTADQAITHLQEQSEALGFDNALDELEEKNTAQIGGDTYIRLQQHYEGIPVYGKTIVYAANEQGELTTVTGNVQDIQGDIDLKPTVTKEEVQSSLSAYAEEKLGYASVDSVSLSFFDEDLCIFVNDRENGAALAYSVIASVTESGMSYPYEIVFDAHTGQILSCYPAVYTDWVPMTLEGPGGIDMLVDITEEQDEDGKTYYTMHDDRRNIHILSANNATLQFELYNYDDELVRDRDGNILKNENTLDVYPVWISAKGVTEPISYSDPPRFEPEAVKLLSNLQTAYDYYEDVFGVSGFTVSSGRAQIYACYNDHLAGDTTNAYCWGYAGVPIYTMLFSFGSDNSLSLDTVAHEYTHAVERKRSCMKYEGESGAIMEGLSDLFGELVESWAQKADPDWKHAGHRNIKDPSKSKLPESYGGKYWVNPANTENDHGGVHYNNTVISHAAYLMWQGPDGNVSARLTTEELATLWYRAMLMMPSDCDFILCRQLVEVAAQSMEELTDQQRACVRTAFDQVGIPSAREDTTQADYHLSEDCTLTVYDKNNEPYGGYTLRISGTIDMKEIASNMTPDIGWVVNRTVAVEEAGPYSLDLPQGRYTLTITDPHYDEIYTIFVEISNEHKDVNIDLITAYEEPLVVVIPEIDYENLVSDAYSDFFTDDYDWEYCFHIPQFNLYGDLARQANQTIYDRCYGILERDAYACMDEYGYSELDGMQYCWGYHGDLASVVIETNSSTAYDPEYAVYTISTATGSAISMDELLIQFGMNREAYYELVYNRLKQYWDEWLVAAESNGNFVANDPFFKSCVTRTLADENIRKTIPYINPTGGLSFVADIYSMAGADSYLHLINAEGKVGADYPECTKDHSKDTAAPTGDALQYFIENCDLVYFTEADIQDFDLEMCLYARNAVFAKSGRKFQNQELQTYFGKYSWYVPCIEPEDFTNDMLNRKQLANVELVQNLERKLKEAQEVENLLATLDGEEGIYTRYLHGGGYEELVGQEVDKNTIEVSSCLIDLDNDGTDELFLSLGTGQSGVRGMETYTFLLDIESGKVVKAVEAYFGGGSMGGDHLGIRYDKDQLRHVLVLEGHTRDGVSAYGTYLDIYSETDFKAGMELFEGYYSLYGDAYRESAANVRAETSLYYEDGEDFRFYQINDAYVTKEAFDSAWARYEEPRDGFQPKAGSFVKPIA